MSALLQVCSPYASLLIVLSSKECYPQNKSLLVAPKSFKYYFILQECSTSSLSFDHFL